MIDLNDYPGPDPINDAEWTKGRRVKSGTTIWILKRRKKSSPTPEPKETK